MHPENLHIEQITRFHFEIEVLKDTIQNEPDLEKKKELAFKYVKLTQLWFKLDEFIEFTLKNELDSILK